MQATSTFSVHDWAPTEVTPTPPVETGTPIGVATMRKVFVGALEGQSSTIFTAAYDQASGTGTYLAMEAFSGVVDGRRGTFACAHSATTTGEDRTAPFFVVVPSSGTGELAGISGTGELTVDADGVHHLRLDYDLPD